MTYFYNIQESPIEPLDFPSHAAKVNVLPLIDPTVGIERRLKHLSILYVEILGGGQTYPHQHHSFDHVNVYLSGRARMHVADEQRDVGPNSVVVVPAGTTHYQTVQGDEPLRFLEICTPAQDIESLREAKLLKE